MILAVRSQLNYVLGNLRAAEADIAEAVQYFQFAGAESSRVQAAKQLEYYRALRKLAPER